MFLPTLLLGALGMLGGAGAIVKTVGAGELGPALLGYAAVLAFSVLMFVVGLYVMTLRAHYAIDSSARVVTALRSSCFGKRPRTIRFEEIESVELKPVRSQSTAHQAVPVPSYTMVLLKGSGKPLHVTSDEHAAALAIAGEMAKHLGVPIIHP